MAPDPAPPAAACVACGGGLHVRLDGLEDDRFGVPGRFSVLACGICGLAQTAPRPGPAELKALYERYYNFGGAGEGRYTRLRERLFGSGLYPLWLALDGDVSFHRRPGHGRLLDFGCNEGRGLERYRAMGFTVEGLELNEKAAERARARGFVVHGGDPGSLKPEAPYQVVVLSNVLEHAPDPGALLGQIRGVLAPGGQVWVSCPNVESWQRALFGRRWINWHVPFHLIHFSRRTLAGTLERGGFTVREMGACSPALWFAQSLIARLFARPGRPTRPLRNPALVALLTLLARGTLFPLLWLGNRAGRGDCLVAVAEVNPPCAS